jgi:hypothetical protein
MPTDEERRICQYTRDLLQDMRSSPYRLEDKVKKNGTSHHETRFIPADHFTALGSSEIENYADKYRSKTNLTTTSLNAQELGLEKSFFPERTWTAYFDPKQKIKGRI